MWQKFLEQYAGLCECKIWEVKYVGVVEFQKWRGAAHIHSLVGKNGADARRLREWAWENCGWNKIYSYVPDKGAEHYICKYIVKDIQDIEFSSVFNNKGVD